MIEPLDVVERNALALLKAAPEEILAGQPGPATAIGGFGHGTVYRSPSEPTEDTAPALGGRSVSPPAECWESSAGRLCQPCRRCHRPASNRALRTKVFLRERTRS